MAQYYGLLDLILGAVAQPQADKQFQANSKMRWVSKWSEQKYWQLILSDAKANIPASVSENLANSPRKSSAGSV